MPYPTQPYGGPTHDPGALGSAALVIARAITLFLGAIPASGLLVVAYVATIMFAAEDADAVFGRIVLFPLALLGTIAIWIAAVRPWPVSGLTALCLMAGVAAMPLFGEVPVLIFPMLFLPEPILALLGSWVLYMPAAIAAAHVVGYIIYTIREQKTAAS